MDPGARKTFIKEEALKLGFEACGIASVRVLGEEEEHLNNFITENRHASMLYMERNMDKRLNPGLLVENARSVISVLYNYYDEKPEKNNKYRVSMYAQGYDYHYIIKQKLQQLAERLTDTFGAHKYRVFTDSAPVLERAWARQAGLGWIGKNSCLIHPKRGSWFFIGEIITTLEAAVDVPVEDRCGTCTRCIDACPTEAIRAPGVLDANRCISYLTIEHKSNFNEEMNHDFRKQIFGCDICQQVCPWNKFATPHKEPLFKTISAISTLQKDGVTSTNDESFKKIFKNTALLRCGEENIIRNIRFVDSTIHK